MCIAIVLVFAVCWVPFSIWWLLFLYSSVRTISSCGFQFFGVIAVFVETIVKVLKISSVASLLVKRLIKLHLGLIPKLFSKIIHAHKGINFLVNSIKNLFLIC